MLVMLLSKHHFASCEIRLLAPSFRRRAIVSWCVSDSRLENWLQHVLVVRNNTKHPVATLAGS